MLSGGDASISVEMGTFQSIPVRCLVCLSCGFVAPCVPEPGLEAVREKARRLENESREKPNKHEFQEL